MSKRVVLAIICLLFVLSLSGCKSPFVVATHPCNQPNTEWVSEDGRVSFYIGDNPYLVDGTIQTENGKTDVLISMGDDVSFIEVYPRETETINDETQVSIEVWYSTVKKATKNRFVVTVGESTYFEEGEEIVFHRVDE